jgi:TolB-like protein
MLQLKLFGQFDLGGPEGRTVAASAKLSALLAYLAIAGKPVSREHLTTLLWGSHFEDQARQNFRQALARLRKALGPDMVHSDEQSVQLAAGAVDCDVNRFEALAKSPSVADLRAAVSIAEDDLLAGIDVSEAAWEEWLSGERRRTGTLACDVLERLGRLELAAGEPVAALKCADACIRRDIFREDAHRLAIQSLSALGRRSEAVKHFQHLAERLKQELGTEPEAATVRAYEAARQNAGTIEDTPAAAVSSRKPSIAVLPFANLSNDPDQDYFIDGMVDEIITALSRLHWLFVIARNSSFTFKGRAVDVKQVGRELGVRYVLEGSVRKAGNRLRISGQLIDAATGAALWADRIEGELSDVFELQDLVTSHVVGAIAPKLEHAEIERSRRKTTGSLDAYDYYLRGQAEVIKWTRAANAAARAHFYMAIDLDPEFSSAWGMAARCYSQSKAQGWIGDPAAESAEVRRLTRRAVELGPDDPVALSASGMALAYVTGDLEGGQAMLDRSLEINPNDPQSWFFSGWVMAWRGESDKSISLISRALALSPHDPNIWNMRRGIAFAYFIGERYEEAISASGGAVGIPQNAVFGHATVAASAAHLGLQPRAEQQIALLREVDGSLKLSNLRERFPMRRESDFTRCYEGLRIAGMQP